MRQPVSQHQVAGVALPSRFPDRREEPRPGQGQRRDPRGHQRPRGKAAPAAFEKAVPQGRQGRHRHAHRTLHEAGGTGAGPGEQNCPAYAPPGPGAELRPEVAVHREGRARGEQRIQVRANGQAQCELGRGEGEGRGEPQPRPPDPAGEVEEERHRQCPGQRRREEARLRQGHACPVEGRGSPEVPGRLRGVHLPAEVGDQPARPRERHLPGHLEVPVFVGAPGIPEEGSHREEPEREQEDRRTRAERGPPPCRGRRPHRAASGLPAAASGGSSGSSRSKQAPAPGRLWAVIRPPWTSAISRAMARPRPAPARGGAMATR